jgi:TonB family protein
MRMESGRGDFFRMTVLALFLACPGAGIGRGQAAAPGEGGQAGATPEEMPKNPDALMRLAIEVNGLGGDEIKPWHLKASYTLADAQGRPEGAGTIEESWAGPHRARTRYTVGSQSLSIYLTEKGTMQSGDLTMTPWLVKAAYNEIVRPLPGLAFIADKSFVGKTHELGGMKLNCLAVKMSSSDHPMGEFQMQTYCFGEDKPIPRLDVTMGGYRQATRNALVRFQGRYIPKDVRVTDKGKGSITVHVDVLEEVKSVDEADLAAPADAKLMQGRVDVSSGIATGRLMKQAYPNYPPSAKAKGIQGMVVLEAVIGTDGHIAELEVVGGPPELQQAAKDSVRQWVYKPYELDGVPVQVDTTISVVFNLGR